MTDQPRDTGKVRCINYDPDFFVCVGCKHSKPHEWTTQCMPMHNVSCVGCVVVDPASVTDSHRENRENHEKETKKGAK